MAFSDLCIYDMSWPGDRSASLWARPTLNLHFEGVRAPPGVGLRDEIHPRTLPSLPQVATDFVQVRTMYNIECGMEDGLLSQVKTIT